MQATKNNLLLQKKWNIKPNCLAHCLSTRIANTTVNLLLDIHTWQGRGGGRTF